MMKETCDKEFENLAGVFDTTIRFTTVVGRSEAKRMSLYEFDRAHGVTKDYTSLTRELISFISGSEEADRVFNNKKVLKKRNQ